jgi:hypothetical protein
MDVDDEGDATGLFGTAFKEFSSKRLRSICSRLNLKGVNAEYKAALTRYTVSGTHESDFYSFCNGKLDVYYLRRHLEQRPVLRRNSMLDSEGKRHGCWDT